MVLKIVLHSMFDLPWIDILHIEATVSVDLHFYWLMQCYVVMFYRLDCTA